MTPRWPQAPTFEQARAFAVAWCLVPVARGLLEKDTRLGALLLVAKSEADGQARAFLAEWQAGSDVPRLLPHGIVRSERAHDALAAIYGGDPLDSLGEAAPAFLSCCAEDGHAAIVAVVSRGDRDLEAFLMDPQSGPGLDVQVPAGDEHS